MSQNFLMVGKKTTSILEAESEGGICPSLGVVPGTWQVLGEYGCCCCHHYITDWSAWIGFITVLMTSRIHLSTPLAGR